MGIQSLSSPACPKCGSGSKVTQTTLMPNGDRARRRNCQNCGYLWYTLQPPEVELSKYRIVWHGGRIDRIKPPPESSQNGKI